MQAVHFIVKEFNAHSQLGMLSWKHIDGVAPNTKFAATEVLVVALVLHAYELRDHIALADLVARAQSHDHAVIAFGFANAVNGRDSGHDDHITALHQTLGARQTHLLNVLVDGRIFFNEQIALRHIGLWLVVVVVTNKILHRVFGEELSEF